MRILVNMITVRCITRPSAIHSRVDGWTFCVNVTRGVHLAAVRNVYALASRTCSRSPRSAATSARALPGTDRKTLKLTLTHTHTRHEDAILRALLGAIC